MEVRVKTWTFFITFYNHLHDYDYDRSTREENFLNADFLKQFKNSAEFASFMEELYVRGTEKMLEGEIDRSGEPCTPWLWQICSWREKYW